MNKQETGKEESNVKEYKIPEKVISTESAMLRKMFKKVLEEWNALNGIVLTHKGGYKFEIAQNVSNFSKTIDVGILKENYKMRKVNNPPFEQEGSGPYHTIRTHVEIINDSIGEIVLTIQAMDDHLQNKSH